MKTIRTLNNKKFITITILLTVFLMTLISCQKSSEISETDRQSDELSLEEKPSDNAEDANGLGKTEDENFPLTIIPNAPWFFYNAPDINGSKWEGTGFIPVGPPGWEEHDFNSEEPTKTFKRNMIPYVMTIDGNIQRADSFLGGSIFAVLGSIEEVYLGEKKSQNVVYITPKNKDDLESKYREDIFKVLQSIFTEDRICDLRVTIELDNTNLESIDEETPIKSNAYRIIVSVNIDGTYEFKYDEKHRFIISPDASRERVYIPISFSDLRNTEAYIRDIIGYSSKRMDSVIVANIPLDRTRQFIAEDAAYFKRQKTKAILLFSLLGLIIISFIFYLIFSIKYYKRKYHA